MKTKKIERDFLPVGPMVSFWNSVLNSIFVAILAFSIYFGVFDTYKNKNLKDDIKLNESSYETILNIGQESCLLKTNSINTASYSITNYYEHFVGIVLKYSYENDYDTENDVDNYNSLSSKFEDIPSVTIENNVIRDGYIAQFYTEYCVGKEDKEGNALVSYEAEDAGNYFINEVLRINDSTSGGEFFQSDLVNGLPVLKADVRTLLLKYVVVKAAVSNAVELDQKFYNYFLSIFENASNLLLEEKVYGTAYDNFNKTEEKLSKYSRFAVFFSVILSIVILEWLLPIFTKDHKNFGNFLTRTLYVSDDEKYGFRQHVVICLSSLFKYSYVAIFLGLISGWSYIKSPVFTIFNISVSSLLFYVLSAIYCVASIVISLINVKDENRTIEALVGDMYLCRIITKSANSKLSDTDLV